jgi:hypothetical protein
MVAAEKTTTNAIPHRSYRLHKQDGHADIVGEWFQSKPL